MAGTPEPVKDAGEVLAFAVHGPPIIIKAAFGGGGRGMKVAWRMDEVVELYESAVREAVTAFGRGECFVEQFLDRPRHIEAQVIADQHGQVVVLGTRDCSLQRRNQKLVEEAPAPFLSDEQRARIHQAAHDICARAGYVSAGTVEFLLSGSGAISFLEVNTRLQVEHPVTEQTTGIDLVLEQLRVADGHPLSISQTPEPQGHAFEFRINAGTWGAASTAHAGPGEVLRAALRPRRSARHRGRVRLQRARQLRLADGQTDRDRRHAPAGDRAGAAALKEFSIEGVASVLPFHRAVMAHEDFVGEADFVHTRWIETDFANTLVAAARVRPCPTRACCAPRWRSTAAASRWDCRWRSCAACRPCRPARACRSRPPPRSKRRTSCRRRSGHAAVLEGGGRRRRAAGDLIAVMEAMKMEMPVTAPLSGRITLIAAAGSLQTSGAGCPDQRRPAGLSGTAIRQVMALG